MRELEISYCAKMPTAKKTLSIFPNLAALASLPDKFIGIIFDRR
jgi:hypothetical protein